MRNSPTAILSHHHGVQSFDVHVGYEQSVLGVTDKGIDVLSGNVSRIYQVNDDVFAVIQEIQFTSTLRIDRSRTIQIEGRRVRDLLPQPSYSLDAIHGIVKNFKIRTTLV